MRTMVSQLDALNEYVMEKCRVELKPRGGVTPLQTILVPEPG